MYGRGSHDKLTDSGDWREHIVLTQHRYMLEDCAHRPVVSRLVRRACRRADAAGARVPGHRRRHLRRGFHDDGAHAALASGSAASTATGCRRCWQRGLTMSRRPHRLSRRRPHGPRHRGRVRLCGPHRCRWSTSRRVDGAAFTKLSSEALGEVRSVAGNARWLRVVRSGRGRDSDGPRVGRAGEGMAQAALSSAPVIFEGVPEVLDLKREAAGGGLQARRAQRRSSLRRHRPSWSTTSPAPSNIPRASSTRTGSIRPFWFRWSRSRPASTPTRPSRRA